MPPMGMPRMLPGMLPAGLPLPGMGGPGMAANAGSGNGLDSLLSRQSTRSRMKTEK